MSEKETPDQVIAKWVERDLTAAAAAGELEPTFEVDEMIDQVTWALAAKRCPVLTGASGVGKTSIIHELARRAAAGDGPPQLQGCRLLQFSLQLRASEVKDPYDDMGPAMKSLLDALKTTTENIVPFFRDIHIAYQYDLEPQISTLADRYPGRLLAEGVSPMMEMMFENNPQLEQRYLLLNMEEPPLEKVLRTLTAWSSFQKERYGRSFTHAALEQGLHLTHRFLARGHQPRKVFEFMDHLAALSREGQDVTETHTFDRFCRVHKIPRFLVDPSIPLDLASLEKEFHDRVLGQSEAIRAVVGRIGLIKAGLSDMRRPFGVFLFAGPTGVGKTHMAQILAEKLFGNVDRMVRFNMADYRDGMAAQILFGNPEAHQFPLRRGLFTLRLLGHPMGVFLLDEFEKAHPNVLDRFLQLVDEGRFVNGAGESISCRSMIIIATTNAGAELYRRSFLGFTGSERASEGQREINSSLEEHFRFELINRFDQVVHFLPLSRGNIRAIALRELEELRLRGGLRERELSLEVDEAVLDWLVAHGYDPDYGARFLRRTLERHVTTALAETIVREVPPPGSCIALTVRNNRITAKPVIPAEEEPQKRESLTLPRGTTEEKRTLDRKSLGDESERTISAAARFFADLEKKKEERSSLLARMNEPSFWERREERKELLDRFRELDVAIRVEERLAGPIVRLKEAMKESAEPLTDIVKAAPLIERAAEALREWGDRLAEEGGGAVWMALLSADPLHPAGSWISELADMELNWCRKLGLSSEVAAYELLDGKVTRIVLDVEGPGASIYLGMEHGTHRLCRTGQRDLRANVEVVPKKPSPGTEWPKLARARRTKNLFGAEPKFCASLEIKSRGLTFNFLGIHKASLSHMVHDLERAWQTPPTGRPETARVYGEHGCGARDNRTGVSAPRLKDVLRGDLDRFLEAWKHRER